MCLETVEGASPSRAVMWQAHISLPERAKSALTLPSSPNARPNRASVRTPAGSHFAI